LIWPNGRLRWEEEEEEEEENGRSNNGKPFFATIPIFDRQREIYC
jgi:hypothetical protein